MDFDRSGWLLAGTAFLLCGTTSAQGTRRVSLGPGGAEGDFESSFSSVSVDGAYVAFWSGASNLVPGGASGGHIYVREVETAITELVSVSSGGQAANLASYNPRISADGRCVAFVSYASNLAAGDTNDTLDIFVHDRHTGRTAIVSVATDGTRANDRNDRPSISADGRYVTFRSDATNLVPGDTNHNGDIFLFDRVSGTTERVSVGAGGLQGNAACYESSISADGRFVAFDSHSSNLVPGGTSGHRHVFVRDRQSGTTELVSVTTGGAQGNSWSERPSISWDGRCVAFDSIATNLVAGDTNGISDVFVHDRYSGTTEIVSDGLGHVPADQFSYLPAISADGRFVAFMSAASNLVAGDTNGWEDIFVRDRFAGTTERASLADDGAEANFGGSNPSISADGRYVTFDSWASNLVIGDTNIWSDVFLRDRGTTTFPSSCDPGVDGVIACPCSNPAAGRGRGCDNSAASGGASLFASGAASLSADSVAFTTSGEKPTALSILLQGDAAIVAGDVYGQGVRCVGGSPERLFAKIALGGSIVAPDFGAGDPSVSARSASMGDVIQAGQKRWYLVYYRDPIVLGGCSPISTFNATQTRQATWSP